MGIETAGGSFILQCAHWRILLCFARDEARLLRIRFPAKHAGESLIACQKGPSHRDGPFGIQREGFEWVLLLERKGSEKDA